MDAALVVTPRLPWTTAEVERAAAMWRDGATADAIAAALGKSAAAVALRLHRFRAAGGDVASRHVLVKWTPERDERLLAMWGRDASVASIAETLGTTACACRARMEALRPRCAWAPSRRRVAKPKPPRVRDAPRPWTEAEDATLLRLRALDLTGDAIGRAIGRTAKAVVARSKALRLRGVAVPAVSHRGFTALDAARARHDGPGSREGAMAEVNVHAVGEVTRDLYELVRQRAPSVDLTEETWRRSVWRAAKRLAEAREDELLLLLESAPRRASAAG